MKKMSYYWALDPKVVFLNHGSFGACPKPILKLQQRLRERMEREPVQFLMCELEPLLDASRAILAPFIGVDPADLVFVSNATTGVNTVLRSLDFGPGDELLITDHSYNACRNAVEYAARRSGARVAIAKIPFPIAAPQQVLEALLRNATPRTKLAVIDHVTSPTALVFPIVDIVRELRARGIETLVDGAHAPGMLPLNISEIGSAFYVGNGHKWLCAPKGAAFLYVRRDKQQRIRPLSISHGANSKRSDRSRFQLEFDWTGTDDLTSYLCLGESINFLSTLFPGGWPELMNHNHLLVADGRKALCAALNIAPPCPEEMIGSMAAIPLPFESDPSWIDSQDSDPLQQMLFDRHRIEIPVIRWPSPPIRVIRISAQAYNAPRQYARLTAILKKERDFLSF